MGGRGFERSVRSVRGQCPKQSARPRPRATAADGRLAVRGGGARGRSAHPGRVALLRLADVLVWPLAVRAEAGVDGHELVAAVLEQRERVREYGRVGRVDGLVAEDEVRRGVRVGDAVVDGLGVVRGRAVRILGVL